jgi:hypothetical protein
VMLTELKLTLAAPKGDGSLVALYNKLDTTKSVTADQLEKMLVVPLSPFFSVLGQTVKVRVLYLYDTDRVVAR